MSTAELITAIQLGDIKKVKKMLKHDNTLVNARDEDGSTMFSYTVYSGNVNIARVFVKYGVDVNEYKEDCTPPLPLFCAVSSEKIKMVRYLLDCGADVNGQDDLKHTALMRACVKGQYSIAKLLIKRGAKINVMSDEGDTAFSCAIKAVYLDIASLLLKKGAVIDFNDFINSHYLLTRSIHNRSLDAVQLLIENGANLNMVNNDQTVYDIAKQYGEDEITLYLAKCLNKSPEDMISF